MCWLIRLIPHRMKVIQDITFNNYLVYGFTTRQDMYCLCSGFRIGICVAFCTGQSKITKFQELIEHLHLAMRKILICSKTTVKPCEYRHHINQLDQGIIKSHIQMYDNLMYTMHVQMYQNVSIILSPEYFNTYSNVVI